MASSFSNNTVLQCIWFLWLPILVMLLYLYRNIKQTLLVLQDELYLEAFKALDLTSFIRTYRIRQLGDAIYIRSKNVKAVLLIFMRSILLWYKY